MNKIKVLLALILVLIPFQSAMATGTKTIDSYIPMDIDIDKHWAYEEMDDLINADIIDGFMDSDNNMYVKPKETVTRAQFVKIIVSALGLESDKDGVAFPDVKQDVWYTDSIRIASELDIIDGKDDGKFHPNAPITRAEITKVIVLAFNKTVQFSQASGITFEDVKAGYWANEYIQKASASEIVFGDGKNFNPKNNATRAEAMVMIHRSLQKEQSNLPADEVLTSFLTDHITRENRLTESSSFEELISLYEENGTGYYRAEAYELGNEYIPELEGLDYSITIDDANLTLDVLQKTDRFATVEASGMIVSVVAESDSMNFDIQEDMNSVYNLKKDPISGEWKIYSYYPTLNGEELFQ